MKTSKLPVIKKKKMIDVKKFVKLASKVRKGFEEEYKTLIEKELNKSNPFYKGNY